jgi:hypothetical protein
VPLGSILITHTSLKISSWKRKVKREIIKLMINLKNKHNKKN